MGNRGGAAEARAPSVTAIRLAQETELAAAIFEWIDALVQPAPPSHPAPLDLANADRDAQRLQRLHTAWERNEWSMQQTISGAADAIPKLERRIDALSAAAGRLTPTRGDQFRMQIGDRVYTARTDAAEALQNRIRRECYNGYIRPLEPGPFGEIAGQPLTYSQHPYWSGGLISDWWPIG